MRLLKWCVLIQVLGSSEASYYHELSMTVLQPPVTLPNDSFFGYSITYDSQSKNLVASAPRADFEGQVFSCDITNKNCSRLDIVQDIQRYDKFNHQLYTDHHFWLGASVKADSKNLLVCAPRYTANNEDKKQDLKQFGTSGRCYRKDLSSNNQTFESLLPIKMKDRLIQAKHNENLTDSFGWSIDIAADHSVRVGGPAMSAGRLMTYAKPTPTRAPGLLNGFSVQDKVAFNFGYSVASGNFFKENEYHFAVGTPYGEYGRGKVLFFSFRFDKYHWSRYGDYVGSLYGAALCSAQLTDGRSSLLVGAPAFYENTLGKERYHTGMVRIFVPGNRAEMTLKRDIFGPKDGGFFGNSIANVGDMDKDGKDEIVIAAPYEDDGRGAVYLYTGAALASHYDSTCISWLQRFQPEGFESFGLSLSALSFSDNGCNDLAIGAPGNDKVVIYHCIPAVTVKLEAHFPYLQNRTDKTGFKFQSCLSVEYPDKPKDVKAKFSVTVRITHPNATLTDKSKDHEVYYETLQTGNKYPCRNITVLTSKDGDYEQDIQFDITARLMDDPAVSKDFDPSKATVSNHSILSLTRSVMAAECKKDRCEPNLKLEIKFTAPNPYPTGSTAAETLRVLVKNKDGDTAYRPCARVQVLPEPGLTESEVTILRAPAACMFDHVRQRTCQLQGALIRGTTWDIGKDTPFELDMTSLTSESHNVTVLVEVFNRCNTSEQPADSQTIKLALEPNTNGVRIDGKTDQGEIVNLTRTDIAVSGKKIHQTYTITNTVGTNWKAPLCSLYLKHNPAVEFEYPIQIYRDYSSTKPCTPSERQEPGFVVLTCDIGDLFKKDIITIVIPFFVQPGTLDGKITEESNTTVHTKISLHFDYVNEDIRKSVTTTLALQEVVVVPLWIIVVAALVGLLLVCLLIFALYECGFLRRKNKEKLEELKTDIKRKSTILQRRSMRLSEGARAALANRTYRELLDEAEQKEAEEAEEAKEGAEACPPTSSNGQQLVLESDLKNQIEMSLQKKLQTKNAPIY